MTDRSAAFVLRVAVFATGLFGLDGMAIRRNLPTVKFRVQRWLAVLVLAATAGSGTWAADNPAQREHDKLTEMSWSDHQSKWAVTVVKLQYANAEELALIIASILPAGLQVIPYAPTNSLIISGQVQER